MSKKEKVKILKPHRKHKHKTTPWTEQEVSEVIDRLEDWLFEEQEFTRPDGTTYIKENNNIFFRDFLFREGLYENWIHKQSTNFPRQGERIEEIRKLQEQKLITSAIYGKTKEAMTKFILQANYGYKERLETTNTNTNTTAITWNETKTYSEDKPQ